VPCLVTPAKAQDKPSGAPADHRRRAAVRAVGVCQGSASGAGLRVPGGRRHGGRRHGGRRHGGSVSGICVRCWPAGTGRAPPRRLSV